MIPASTYIHDLLGRHDLNTFLNKFLIKSSTDFASSPAIKAVKPRSSADDKNASEVLVKRLSPQMKTGATTAPRNGRVNSHRENRRLNFPPSASSGNGFPFSRSNPRAYRSKHDVSAAVALPHIPSSAGAASGSKAGDFSASAPAKNEPTVSSKR